MRGLADGRGGGGAHASDFSNVLHEMETADGASRAAGADLREDVKAVSRLAHMVIDVSRQGGGGGGGGGVGTDVEMVRDEYRSKADEVRSKLAALEDDAAAMAADVRVSCPLALEAAGVAVGGAAAHKENHDPAAGGSSWAGSITGGSADVADAGPDGFEALRGRFPSAPREALEDVRVAFESLRGEYGERRRALEAAEAEARGGGGGQSSGGGGLEGGGEGTTGRWGPGWSAAEHAKFARMLAEAEVSAGGKGAAAVLDALCVRLPGHGGRERLAAHVAWSAARRRHARDLRGLREAESRARGALAQRAAKELTAAVERHGRRAADAAQALEQDATCRRLHDRVSRDRADRAAAAEAEAFLAEAERTAAAAAEAAAAAKLAADRSLDKARAEVRREQRAEAEAEAERGAAAVVAANAWMREAVAEANQLRVAFRRDEEERRSEERRAKEAVAEEANEERERRLQRLRATVAPVAARDPARATAATAASASEYVPQLTHEATGAMQRVHGYTTEHLLKDQRFRVSEALHTAGLTGTTHVRHAMAAAAPYRPPRTDTMTTNERAGRSGSAFG